MVVLSEFPLDSSRRTLISPSNTGQTDLLSRHGFILNFIMNGKTHDHLPAVTVLRTEGKAQQKCMDSRTQEESEPGCAGCWPRDGDILSSWMVGWAAVRGAGSGRFSRPRQPSGYEPAEGGEKQDGCHGIAILFFPHASHTYTQPPFEASRPVQLDTSRFPLGRALEHAVSRAPWADMERREEFVRWQTPMLPSRRLDCGKQSMKA